MADKDIEAWKKILVGKTLLREGEVMAEDMDKSMVVFESALPKKHRILGPSTMYTADYVEDRLNVRVDPNVITGVFFG
ncbi:hypothetical protein BDF19DRAFT_453360 [Syncephalis fuscata]|nr:hypothetical protein BDF19DRAFT_453360 [Syncephalis fuscata]